MNPKKEKLRKDILDKFRTVKNFCSKSEIPYRKFIAYLNSTSNNETLHQDARFKLEDIIIDHIEGEIKEEDRKAIRLCVLTNFNSYTDFHKKHKDYDAVYLSNIATGRLETETNKYNVLIKILTRDYKLELRKKTTD